MLVLIWASEIASYRFNKRNLGTKIFNFKKILINENILPV